jgi:hypothetical protein
MLHLQLKKQMLPDFYRGLFVRSPARWGFQGRCVVMVGAFGKVRPGAAHDVVRNGQANLKKRIVMGDILDNVVIAIPSIPTGKLLWFAAYLLDIAAKPRFFINTVDDDVAYGDKRRQPTIYAGKLAAGLAVNGFGQDVL